MSKVGRYIIIIAVLGFGTWLLTPTSERGLSESKDKSARLITHGHTVLTTNIIQEGITDGRYIPAYEAKLTSDYSYSIIDSYWSSRMSDSHIDTTYIDGKPFIKYDKECVKDVYQREGYMSRKTRLICLNLQREIGNFLPDLIDKCYYNIAIPLANDSDVYSIVDRPDYAFPSLNMAPCSLYYLDSPFAKYMNNTEKMKKYAGTVEHIDIYEYRESMRKYNYMVNH